MTELFDVIKSENDQQRKRIAVLLADVEEKAAAGEPVNGDIYHEMDMIGNRISDLFFIATNIKQLSLQ